MENKYKETILISDNDLGYLTITPKILDKLMTKFSEEVRVGNLQKIPYNQWKMLSLIASDKSATIQIFNDFIFCKYKNALEVTFETELYARESSFVLFAIDQIKSDIFKNCNLTNIDNFFNERKDETMKGFNFDFGACKNENIRMSVYGLAIKNINDEWVSYDTKTGKIFNVDIFNFEGRNFFYKLPVAIKDIKIGDVIIHQRVPMFITSNITDNKVVCVDPRSGEEKIIIPTASPFGFDFVTKVVSIFDMTNLGATSDTPFGNMLPFMMMGEDSDIDPMMLILMSQGAGAANNLFANPMMLYFLCGDKGNKDNMLPLMLMMNQNNK